MKTLRTLFLALAASSAFASANAITWTDIDLDGKNGEPHYTFLKSSSRHHYRRHRRGRSAWSSTFNLIDSGYDSSVFRIISATVEFAFADDGGWRDGSEYFGIFAGGDALWRRLEVDGVVDYRNNDSDRYARYRTSLNAAQIADLQDGVIDYSVRAIRGDAWLKEAKIVAVGESVRVPDSVATGSLLAVVLFGLVAFRNSMRRPVKDSGT